MSLYDIISELEETTRAEVEAAARNFENNENANDNASLKRQDYFKLIRLECIALDIPVPKNMRKMKKDELSSIYSQLKKRSITERNFYEIFLTRYEFLTGYLIGDRETAEEKMEKFEEMGFYALKDRYLNTICFRRVVQQIDALSSEGLDSLIDGLEHTAREQAQNPKIWKRMQEISEHIVDGDAKWFQSEYDEEDLKTVIKIYNDNDIVKIRFPEKDVLKTKDQLVKIYLLIQDKISQYVDNIPAGPEECIEKAFYVLFIPKYSIITARYVKEEGPSYVFTSSAERVYELLDMNVLRTIYMHSIDFRSLIRQINKKTRKK